MDIEEFEASAIILRSKLQEAVDEPITETRAGGPFGNRVIRYGAGLINVNAVLDRGDLLVTVEITPDEPYDLEYLHSMLFPQSENDIVNLNASELKATLGWVIGTSRSPKHKSLREAYLKFEHARNMEELSP